MKFQKLKLSVVVSAALVSMGGGTAFAQEVADTVETDEVKVTASRVEQELLDVPMSVTVLTQKDIERSPAMTVGDLLKNVPGIRVMNDGSQGMKRVQIRGEDAFRTVILVDGQRISEHKSMSGAPFLISPSMIERIEVIKGPASVLYGSDAIGGVVNIITKKRSGEEGFVHGEVGGGLTSGNSGKSLYGSVYGQANGFEYRISGSIEDVEDLHTPDGDVKNTGYSARNASAYLAYNFTPDTKAGLTIDHYDLDFQSSVQDMAAAGYDDFLVDVPKWTRTKGALFFESKNITDSLVRLRADAFYQKNDKDMHNRVYVSPMKMDNYADNSLDTYGFSLQTDWQLGENHYLIAGYELMYDDLDATTDTHTRVAMGAMNIYARSLSVNDGYQMTNSIYASMQSTLPADFTLNYGVRYTWVKSEVKTRSGSGSSMAGIDPGTPSLSGYEKNDNSDSRPVFNVGLVWRGLENTALRATWAQGFRVPNLMERYIATSMGGGTVIQNPDLDPETSNNFEIGARFTPGRSVLDISLFYSDADDYIESFEISDGIYQNKNVAGARTFGVEVEASYRFENGLEPYVIGTWMRRRFEQDGYSTYDSGTPEWYGRYGVKWTGRLQGLGVRVDAHAVSQSETTQYDFDDRSRTGFAGSTHYNLTGGVSFGPEDAYNLDVGFYNITNKAYKLSDAIYEPGRYVAVKLNAKF